ncbi:acyltransferase domain-containing protein [Streptomyces sp. NPDC049837]|uniref:acyltransferase domain-containing protein n=1 Tax=Streptomyces sp. NPDC049837 TaxID=3155277 RepID=UPI00341EB070
MSATTITARDSGTAGLGASGPVLWHLSLFEAGDRPSAEARMAALTTHLTGAFGQEDVPVRIRALGADGRYRGAVVAGGGRARGLAVARVPAGGPVPVAFFFPGPGGHHPDMGRDLYRDFPVFRAALDRCARLLAPELGLDIREVVFPDPEPGRRGRGERPLGTTGLAHPALFVVEYALARLWQSWGARPSAMTGHGTGEYVAATLAGVLSLPDALALVARGAPPRGATPAVPDPAHLLLEAGPGRAPGGAAGTVVATMRPPHRSGSDSAAALEALGRLWLAGADIDWARFPAAAPDPGPRGAGEPATPTERALHVLWAELLRIERLPRDAGFFGAGGDSLLATRLIRRVEETFGVGMTLRQVYEWPTIARMAEAIDTRRAAGDGATR